MQIIADLQLHSRFSRAVSQQMSLPYIAAWAAKKGIGLVATGDWTHPMWFREIVSQLEEQGNGLLKFKIEDNTPFFLLATEVSCIYSQGGKLRRIHALVWVPTIAAAEKINKELTRRGCNLMADGRPIIGLTSIQLAELVLSQEPKALLIPAHSWTPFFSVFGSASGFDSIEEAFGRFAKNIYAVETGLSSSPAMNWRIAELDNRSIVSFSDAHSGPKIGREATVFDLQKISYDEIYEAIRSQKNIAYTIEFHPEEGKYHFSGHRTCGIRWGPQESKQKGTTCPVCGKPLTQGVMQRVEELASRAEADLKLSAVSGQLSAKTEVRMMASKAFPHRPPYVMTVPLLEILAEAIGSPVGSPKVAGLFDRLVGEFGGEFNVLLTVTAEEIARIAGSRVSDGIDKVRRGDIVIEPGYDGVFGVVKIWGEGTSKDVSKEQLAMF